GSGLGDALPRLAGQLVDAADPRRPSLPRQPSPTARELERERDGPDAVAAPRARDRNGWTRSRGLGRQPLPPGRNARPLERRARRGRRQDGGNGRARRRHSRRGARDHGRDGSHRASRMTEEEVLRLFETCSNAGRWGPDDERGTLNYVTREKRLEALALVRDGDSVSIGRDLIVRDSTQSPPSTTHALLYAGHEPSAALELLTLVPHGFEMTHLDAVTHSYFEGQVYNGRRAAQAITPGGVAFGSIMAAADGIVTRGVLLDVAATRGVAHLDANDGIGVDDLERAEALAETRVRSGDAVFIRSGQALRERDEG